PRQAPSAESRTIPAPTAPASAHMAKASPQAGASHSPIRSIEDQFSSCRSSESSASVSLAYDFAPEAVPRQAVAGKRPSGPPVLQRHRSGPVFDVLSRVLFSTLTAVLGRIGVLHAPER